MSTREISPRSSAKYTVYLPIYHKKYKEPSTKKIYRTFSRIDIQLYQHSLKLEKLEIV